MHFHTHTHEPVENTPPSGLNEGIKAEIREALRLWRGHANHGSELTEPVDPARDHVCGDPAAPVQVVEYGCYGPSSSSEEELALRATLRRWLDEGTISLAFRHFPVIDSYPDAWLGAQAVEAADRQGRFWEMHQSLTNALAQPWVRKFDRHRILDFARRLELETDRFKDDMGGAPTAERIFRDVQSGIRSGVNGTPTFYVQGIRQDIDTPDELHARVESALAGDRAALWPPVSLKRQADGNIAIARLWHDGLASGDFSASAEFWAEDVDWQGWNEELPGGGVAIGRDVVEDLHRRSPAAASGFRVLAHDYIQHGNRVLVVGEATSDAPGCCFHLPYVQIWDMEAGKATCVRTLTDTLAIARALGEPAAASRAPLAT